MYVVSIYIHKKQKFSSKKWEDVGMKKVQKQDIISMEEYLEIYTHSYIPHT